MVIEEDVGEKFHSDWSRRKNELLVVERQGQLFWGKGAVLGLRVCSSVA